MLILYQVNFARTDADLCRTLRVRGRATVARPYTAAEYRQTVSWRDKGHIRAFRVQSQ